jgi:hypothetical protein
MLELYNIVALAGGTAVLTFFGILLFLRIGRWIGKQMLAKHGGELPQNVGSLEAAVFALMGLLIAFTFSGALTRFDSRRIQAVDEANAIGTAYLRIDLLPASAQPKLRAAMRDYVDARIATYGKLPDLKVAQVEAARAMQLQNEIWAQAVAATRLPDARAGADLLVMPALNEMFDLASTRLAATKIHPPLIIYIMLIGLAFAAGLLAGYQSATESHDWMRKLAFAFIVACTVYVILEIEYPRLGLVRIDAIDQLLVNARAGMN